MVGSFSSKSVNTYDESNQSVAQELNFNESIAIQTYNVGAINQNQVNELMNSDEIQKINEMIP